MVGDSASTMVEGVLETLLIVHLHRANVLELYVEIEEEDDIFRIESGLWVGGLGGNHKH